jgi:hypothetical protein
MKINLDEINLDDCRKQITTMAEKQGINLTLNDHEILAQFAKYILECRQKKA